MLNDVAIIKIIIKSFAEYLGVFVEEHLDEALTLNKEYMGGATNQGIDTTLLDPKVDIGPSHRATPPQLL